MLQIPSKSDILIVGAGPTGLALAAELKRLGRDAAIVDRQPAGANTSRAAVVHAHTLEVLESLGVTPQLIGEGVKVPIFRVRDRDRALITIDFSEIPSAYRFTLMCPQDRTEQILLQRLQQLGGGVVRPCRFIGAQKMDDGIEAELDCDGRPLSLRARWLVGCDGMHSAVRDVSGIGFAGAAYEQSFVLADVALDWPLSRDEVSLFFSPDGLVVVAPLPENRFRIVATVDEAPDSPSAEFMQDILDRRGPFERRGRIANVVWSSRFHIHHRVAETPRNGRILLCGDAAHVHSPAGGQGMNTGIQDAVSLAGALDRTLKTSDEASLDDWASARHRVASEVVAFTDRMTKMATMKSPLGQLLRNSAIGLAGHLPPLRAKLATKLAELENT